MNERAERSGTVPAGHKAAEGCRDEGEDIEVGSSTSDIKVQERVRVEGGTRVELTSSSSLVSSLHSLPSFMHSASIASGDFTSLAPVIRCL